MKLTHRMPRFLLTLCLAFSLLSGVCLAEAPAEEITLTYWIPLAGNVMSRHASYGELENYIAAQAATGINIEFIHPAVGQEKEQFNLMLSSRSLPDMFTYSLANYPGGEIGAAADGLILQLDELFELYAPDVLAMFERRPDYAVQSRADDGHYYNFPSLQEEEYSTISFGPQIRQDFLDKLGLEVPTTIDEWETMLRLFKSELELPAPLTFNYVDLRNSHAFVGAYGIAFGLYTDPEDGGVVKFGPSQPAFKDFLTTMARWYADGLLDPEFASQDNSAFDSKNTGGKSGSWLGTTSSKLKNYLTMMKDKNPEFNLVGAPYPSLVKGEPVHFQQKVALWDPNSTYISATAENPEAIARFLNYGYTEEGYILYNWGIEGKMYTVVDGKPQIIPEVYNAPERYDMNTGTAGPFIKSTVTQKQMYASIEFPQVEAALDTWSTVESAGYLMPPVTLNKEESTKATTIASEINTYVDEMVMKFIIGVEPVENFDTFVKTLDSMKVDEMVAVYQSALERYNAK